MFLANLKQRLSKQLPFLAFEFLFLATACLLIFNATMGQNKSQFLVLSLLYLLSLAIFSTELIKKAYDNKTFLSSELSDNKE